MKTNEEVKEHFKNAKEVKCLSDGNVYDITKEGAKQIHQPLSQECWICSFKTNVKLSNKEGDYAEIISTKDHIQEYNKSLKKLNVYEWKWICSEDGELFVLVDYYTSKKDFVKQTHISLKIISKIKSTKRIKSN
jgi:hypothetical protein